jgi:hypothetical protein
VSRSVGDVSKFIFFLLLGVAVYWWLRGKRLDSGSHEKRRADGPEVMVRCTYCGLHVPQSESVTVDDRHYCGDEHRQLDSNGKRN